jgi:hypothetical protein
MRRRIALVALLAWLGVLLGFLSASPDARAGIRRDPPGAIEHEVPLAWIAQALSEMPFLIPPAR